MAKKKVQNDALATNNKARYNYAIGETFEAGIELTGTEIKSVRASQITIAEGFIQVRHGQAWLDNVNIAIFEQGNQFNHEPLRSRRLLLHKKENIFFLLYLLHLISCIPLLLLFLQLLFLFH